ncbi:unnamed protein product [Adineta steineri]|uniref:G-protein coupled receptors family 1 profile domain-containing protein n=2 Tax=Adineta steineri TaxID=433720 RepID=A0A815SIM2_9BILA|nr:unnamed protein product [Adineta steineri]
MSFQNNSNATNLEIWIIPCDILQLVLNVVAAILAIFFLFFAAIDKKCHTIPMMLTINSCLSEFILTNTLFWAGIFTLINDLQQIQHKDSLCVFRCYLIHCGCFLQGHSYLLQAIYRYIKIIYPSRLSWQSRQSQLLLIGTIWILAFVHAIPFLFFDGIVYNVDNQVCQMVLGFYFLMIYMMFVDYILPMILIMLVYFKLLRYIKKMGKRVTSTNTLSRAQRELKMVRRAVIMITTIITVGFPFTLFMIMAFFDSAPKYHFRIIFLFGSLSILVVMIILFQFTDSLKISIIKRIKKRSNKVLPALS